MMTAPPQSSIGSRIAFWRTWLAHQQAPFQLGLALVLLTLVVIMTVSSPTFLTTGNVLNVFRQASPTLIVAVAMTLVITSGGIDLSVGSTLAVVGVLSAVLLSAGCSWWVVVLLMLGFGSVIGLMNGWLVTLGGLPPFIATLATLSILRGVAQLITKGYSIPVPPNSAFVELGRGFFLGVPYPILIAGLALGIGYILFARTQFGIYVIGIGSNEEAVRRNGVDTNGVKGKVDVFSAVVLGGTNLFGGDGTLLGTFLGTIILAVIGNGLILLQVSPFYEQIIKGVILVIAIILNRGALLRAFKYQ